jgi:GNAT superfamily N-acetyltransferase
MWFRRQDRQPMRTNISIKILTEVDGLQSLAADADADDYRMVSRLMEEWINQTNRFDGIGERLYCAIIDSQICGVCGLNRDPFANDPTVGRVRRLYVTTAQRRQGVASSMLWQLVSDARAHFRLLHLRTHDPMAAAFYESVGFLPVHGEPTCTHRRSL